MQSSSNPEGPPRRRRSFLLAAGIALSVMVGACGSDSDSGDSASATAGDTASANDGSKVLSIKDFTFKPEPLVVPKGTVIKVVNEDDAAHTATADDKSFDTGTLDKGASKEITLAEAGEIAYHCTIHDYMQGVIRVSA